MVNAELIVKENLKMFYADFYKAMLTNEKLLRAAKSRKKYKFKSGQS